MRAYASILRTGWKKKKEGVLTWPGGGKVHYLSPEALSFPPFRFLTVHDMKEGRKAAQPIFIKTCTAAAVKKRGGGDDSGGGGGNMCGTERWHQLINIFEFVWAVIVVPLFERLKYRSTVLSNRLNCYASTPTATMIAAGVVSQRMNQEDEFKYGRRVHGARLY